MALLGDSSLERILVCPLDNGPWQVLREKKIKSEPDIIIEFLTFLKVKCILSLQQTRAVIACKLKLAFSPLHLSFKDNILKMTIKEIIDNAMH